MITSRRCVIDFLNSALLKYQFTSGGSLAYYRETTEVTVACRSGHEYAKYTSIAFISNVFPLTYLIPYSLNGITSQMPLLTDTVHIQIQASEEGSRNRYLTCICVLGVVCSDRDAGSLVQWKGMSVILANGPLRRYTALGKCLQICRRIEKQKLN